MIDRIKDFIQAFFYYPKMRKRLRNRKMEQYDIWHSAFRYAKWHCLIRKLKPNNQLILDDLVEPINNALKNNDWKPLYKQPPITESKESNRNE